MDPEYVESVWWSLKQIYDKGLLVEDYRITPYCPRCGTALSDHELGQPGLRDGRRPVGLRAVPGHLRPARRHSAATCWSGPPRRGRWCPTPPSPCTPTSPTSSPDRRRRGAGRRRAAARRGARRGLRGRCATLTGARARRRCDVLSGRSTLVDDPATRTTSCSADYVTTEDGTGLVHQAPAFGADDLAGRRGVRPAGRQPGRARRHVRRRRAAGRRHVLQGGRRRSRRATCSERGLLFRHERVRAPVPALLALPHAAACTTRCRPGTSGRPQVKDALLAREREHQLVSRRRSSRAGTATGCATTSTGRCPAPATGARRCRSGAAPRRPP